MNGVSTTAREGGPCGAERCNGILKLGKAGSVLYLECSVNPACHWRQATKEEERIWQERKSAPQTCSL